jgi:hypothetical protein
MSLEANQQYTSGKFVCWKMTDGACFTVFAVAEMATPQLALHQFDVKLACIEPSSPFVLRLTSTSQGIESQQVIALVVPSGISGDQV